MNRRARMMVLLSCALGLTILAMSAAASGAPAHHKRPAPHHFVAVGIGDEQPGMFASPAYKALGVRIGRYVAPYDVADDHSRNGLPRLRAWLAAARRDHVQPLIAFYHSNKTATRMPTVKHYDAEMHHFLRLFGRSVSLLQPWNEANRGYVREHGRGSFSSPSAAQAAAYYLALRSLCHRCTVVGLDVLDSTNVKATIGYVNQFKRDVGARRIPRIWGLHNYTDTNRFRNAGTKAFLANVPGQVWLTETGAVVKLAPSFPFSYYRPVHAIHYMFSLANSNPRITRLYIFQWTGGNVSRERFDAGLTDRHGTPRPAYCAVFQHLKPRSRCPYRPARD